MTGMPKGTRILITGASGTLGGPLTALAATRGDVYAAYFSRPDRVRAGQGVRLDLRDGQATRAAIRQLDPDVILHAAVTERSGPGFAEAITLAAQHVAEGAAEISARLVALSTDLVLDGRADLYDDAAPPDPLPDGEYGAAKAAAEQIIRDILPTASLVRTSLIYDFQPENPQVAWMLRRIEAGEPVTLFTDQIRCPIWADNLAGAVLELAQIEHSGVLNIVGPEPMSRYDLGCGLLAALGHDPAKYVIPASAPETMPRRLVLDVIQARRLLRTPLLRFAEARHSWERSR